MDRRIIRALAAGILFLVPSASAQNLNDINAGIQFDFSLPGARSLAMGGAFVALADDATAAYSNPAGLVVLNRPEFSLEGRGWGFQNFTADVGHVFGAPSNIGVDTVAGLIDRGFDSDAAGLSFLSFVYPSERWSLGVFRHELSRFNTSREFQGPFFNCAGGYRDDTPPQAPFCGEEVRGDGVDRIFPSRQNIAVDITSVGTSFAVKVSDSLSVGVSALYYDFTMDARNSVFAARRENRFTEADFTYPDNLELESTQSGKDHTFAANAGVLFRPSPNLTIGAAYRQGPEFQFELRSVFGNSHPAVLDGREIPGNAFAWEPANPFKVPDTYALGVAFNPTQAMTLSFEYDRVQFSQLTRDLRDAAHSSVEESAVLMDRIEQGDANQIRAGFEYLKLFREKILALQVGFWYDPDHRVRFAADDPATGYPAPRWALLFQEGSDQYHFTTGVGFVFSEHLQIDAAFDWSEFVQTLSLSTVLMF
jgi:long-subunit fatty acid transport protein